MKILALHLTQAQISRLAFYSILTAKQLSGGFYQTSHFSRHPFASLDCCRFTIFSSSLILRLSLLSVRIANFGLSAAAQSYRQEICLCHLLR